MKMFPLTLFAACGVALATTAAYAGDDESKRGSGQVELQMMDTDHDGSVSATEHAAGAKKMFEKMDADGDGIVTAQEMGAAHQDMPTARSEHSGTVSSRQPEPGTSDASGKPLKSASAEIKAIDTDADGAITAAEHEAGSKKMFGKMDKDGNGKLTAAEIQAGHDRMMTAEEQ
jgi:Ca2+-binding EF-hand superfamily protein